jgi:GDP-mannose pyrophosphatase NudK
MNNNIEILESKILSDDWYVLKKVAFRQRDKIGNWSLHNREVYDRGNGATILLYNAETQSVILTRQFRLPTFVNGNESGMLIETCAGLLDDNDPQTAILRETEEETGYKIDKVRKIFEAYMSPGSVTEVLHFYVGEYSNSMRVSLGGGTGADEQIEVLELKFDTAYHMIESGEIRDAKTIILLQYARIKGLLK